MTPRKPCAKLRAVIQCPRCSDNKIINAEDKVAVKCPGCGTCYRLTISVEESPKP